MFPFIENPQMYIKIIILLFFLTLTIFITNGKSQELIAFKNKTHVICVSDNTKVPIYVEPVRERNIQKINALIEFETTWGDWRLRNSSQTLHAPVTDARWQDFNVKCANKTNFLMETSFSFWVYQPSVINISVEYLNQKQDHRLSETNASWTSFTIYTYENSTYFLQNNETYRTTNNIPTKLTVQTVPKIQQCWKLQDYKVRVAYNVSSTSTNIVVPSCLVMYVYLCDYCFLEISTETVITLNGTNSTINNLYVPQKLEFENILHVSLRRYTTNGFSEGYWAIDIRRCAFTKLNQVTYDVSKSASNTTSESVKCMNLNIEGFKNKKSNILHCNQTGTFGNQCNIHCEELFGKERQFCEGYEVCLDGSVCSRVIVQDSCTSSTKWSLFICGSILAIIIVSSLIYASITLLIGRKEKGSIEKQFQEYKALLDPEKNFPKYKEDYIPRQVSANYISINYLNEFDKNTLVVLDCCDHLDQMNIGNFNLIRVSRFLEGKGEQYRPRIEKFVSGPDLYVSEKCCKEKDFNKICEKNCSIQNIHHLRIIDEFTLEWIRSKGNPSSLKKYYKDDYINEHEFYEKLPKYKINVLTAESGMGKSELLKNFKNAFANKPYVVLKQAKDMNLLCEKFKKCCYLTEEMLAHFLKKNCNKDISSIKEDNVAFFWDGLDEIKEENFEQMTNLIKALSRKYSFQWVTASSHMQEYLENKFHVLARKMKPFNREDRKTYVEKRLQNKFESEQIEELLHDITSMDLSNLSEKDIILNIPLEIYMLTDLLIEDHNKHFSSFQKDKNLFLMNLYDKSSQQQLKYVYKETSDDQKEKMYEIYEKAALVALTTAKFCRQHQIDRSTGGQRETIILRRTIQEILNKDEPRLHKAYIAFLVAMYFTKHPEIDFRPEMFKCDYPNVQFFYNRNKLLQEHQKNNSKREVLRFALLADIGQKYPDFDVTNLSDGYEINNKNDCFTIGKFKICQEKIKNLSDGYEINNKNDCLTIGESEIYQEEMKNLLNRYDGDLNELLYYAEDNGYLWIRLQVLRKQHTNSKNKNDEKNVTNSKKQFDEKKDFNLLYFATKFGYDEAFDLFDQIPLIRIKKDNGLLLHLAVNHNQDKCVEKLISMEVYQVKINEPDEKGETSLFKACKNGSVLMVKMLLEKGADKDINKKDGTTPLHTASFNNHPEVVELLLKRGIKVNVTKDHNITPLHLAAWNGHFKIVEILLGKDADINATTTDLETALYVASRNNHVKVVDILLDSKCKIDIQQKDGATALVAASQQGHVEVVERLLKAGADVNICTKTSKTAFDMAQQNGYVRVMTLLTTTITKV